MVLRKLFICLFIFAAITGFSQTLSETGKTVINFGKGRSQVTIEEGGGEHWKPLFFDIDSEGLIHIPDFYKNRIAVFNGEGRLKKELPLTKGISPRLNYFALAPNGGYVTYNDNTLYLLDEKGAVTWELALGIGMIPQNVLPMEAALFVLFPGLSSGNTGTLVFTYYQNQPLGAMSVEDSDGKNIPIVQSEEGNIFSFTLAAMTKLPDVAAGWSLIENSGSLLGFLKDDESVWSRKMSRSQQLYRYSADGKELFSGTILFQGDKEGTGFWTIVTDDFTVYKNYFYKDKMEIVSYTVK